MVEYKVGVIGCGYVGLSLIKSFSKVYNTVGYDISKDRINFLNNTHKLDNVIYTTKEINISSCNIYLIAVPTNIDKNSKQINLEHLLSVKNLLKKYINKGDVIILESSIYIGGTRDLFSDFLKDGVNIGFSPERISPGDYEDCSEIPKIMSGLTDKSCDIIDSIYSKIIKYTIKVSSTECAETCKLYENCFRVVNIAYVNEIADMCKNIGIDVKEVVEASSTKPFGFMPFNPGFGIGGFCLPQNPYYLMYKSISSEFPVLSESIKSLNNRPKKRANEINYKNILLIGIGFKANQQLTAFSPALVLYNELIKQKKNVTLYDYNLNVNKDFDFTIQNLKKYECIIIGCKNDNLDIDLLDEYKDNNYGEVIYC